MGAGDLHIIEYNTNIENILRAVRTYKEHLKLLEGEKG